MNSFNFKVSVFILIIISTIMFAQESNFDTHSINLKGELSKDDGYQDNFGRFDAYELSLQNGDFIKIKLNAEFFPLLTVVAPSGKHKIAFPSDTKPDVNLESEIDETGHWYIYVSGDSTDTGVHDLELCYVAENTRQFPEDADICTLTKFLLAHSNTKYFYFRNKDCEITNNKWDVDINNQNLFNEAEITVNGNSISFNLMTNSQEGKDKFNELTYKISECLTDEWIEKGGNDKTVFTESNGSRIIKIALMDNTISLSFVTSIK